MIERKSQSEQSREGSVCYGSGGCSGGQVTVASHREGTSNHQDQTQGSKGQILGDDSKNEEPYRSTGEPAPVAQTWHLATQEDEAGGFKVIG